MDKRIEDIDVLIKEGEVRLAEAKHYRKDVLLVEYLDALLTLLASLMCMITNDITLMRIEIGSFFVLTFPIVIFVYVFGWARLIKIGFYAAFVAFIIHLSLATLRFLFILFTDRDYPWVQFSLMLVSCCRSIFAFYYLKDLMPIIKGAALYPTLKHTYETLSKPFEPHSQ
jgi:hypothetical protein